LPVVRLAQPPLLGASHHCTADVRGPFATPPARARPRGPRGDPQAAASQSHAGPGLELTSCPWSRSGRRRSAGETDHPRPSGCPPPPPHRPQCRKTPDGLRPGLPALVAADRRTAAVGTPGDDVNGGLPGSRAWSLWSRVIGEDRIEDGREWFGRTRSVGPG